MENPEEIGFFAALFDFSFSRFVSVSLIRIAYVLALLVGVFIMVATVVMTFFNSGFLAGIFSLVIASVAFIVFAVIARVWLEFVVVIFRIADHTKKMADQIR